MTRQSWNTSFGWSVRIWGRVRLSPSGPLVPKQVRGTLRTWMRWAINACVLLLLIPGAVHLDSDVLNAEAIAEYFGYGTDAVLATDIGEHREATLHGGAQITLNSGTAVRMRSTRQYQEAALESGEVLVTVTRESSRRVGVVAGDVAIEATQARYSVRKLASGAYMARVYDGEVTIAPHVDRRRSLSSRAAFQPVRVGRGRAADIQPGRVALSAFDADDAPRLLSWTAGFLVFKGETLGEAAEEFNRYNRQQIVVADKALRRAQVGGWFDATNPEGFARAVAQMFGVHVTSIRSGGRGASVIVLSTRPRASVRGSTVAKTGTKRTAI